MIKDLGMLFIIEAAITSVVLCISITTIKKTIKSNGKINLVISIVSVVLSIIIVFLDKFVGTSNLAITGGVTYGIVQNALNDILERQNYGAALGLFGCWTGLILANFSENTIFHNFGIFCIFVGAIAAGFELFRLKNKRSL